MPDYIVMLSQLGAPRSIALVAVWGLMVAAVLGTMVVSWWRERHD